MNEHTYVFVGGLTIEEAFQKVKKYYPDYDRCMNQHSFAVNKYPENGAVSYEKDRFGWCDNDYYINKGYPRLDIEDKMDKYHKVTSFGLVWCLKNVKFHGDHITADEAYTAKGNKDLKPLGKMLEITSIEESSEEEFNKFKKGNVTVELNLEYSAVINKDDVVVGCQHFTHDSILNLAKEIEKFLDK